MKISKVLLVVSSFFFINAAQADEGFFVGKTKLSSNSEPAVIKLKKQCVMAEDLKIVAQDAKVELKKARVVFQSGKDKNVVFLSTLEAGEDTRWRSIGWYGKKSCIDYIEIDGYAKHVKKAQIHVYGKN